MEKRIILAFVLSFAILYAFQIFRPPAPTSPTEPTGAVQEATKTPKAPPTPAPPPVRPAGEIANVPVATPVGEIHAEEAEQAVIDTPLYTAKVSNVGGSLRSFKLKAYSGPDGNPIELIDEKAGQKLGWPLVVATSDADLNATLAEAIFVMRRGDNRISMEYARGGLHAQRTFQFGNENYEFSVATEIYQDGKQIPSLLLWQGGFGDQSIPPDPAKRNALYQQDAGFKRISLRSIKEQQHFTLSRAGVEDQYFLAMFLVPDGVAPVTIEKKSYTGDDGKPVEAISLSMTEMMPVRAYVGPKDQRWLTKADAQLDSVINYGWFQVIARPLMFILLFVHSYIGNFGWSIILLTIAINLLLFPLRLKQQISMQRMQKLQPQMRTLQDRYKKLKGSDPRRAQVQAEMMDLYKEHGVNPMGGCLPMLLQMPVLFGFYSMLSVSIELRRAPWILWIQDLSQHDPYYIIPILMAVSMFVMQRMTPTTVDPAQAKMMMVMPLFLTVMFLWVQSGLMLYWLTSNLVGIGQQIFINKYWSPRADAKVQLRSRAKESHGK